MDDAKAFWISPQGAIYPVTRSHIAMVITDPGLFGLTREYIEAIYKKYGEPLGWEGNAREEIVVALLRRGWVRIRNYEDYLSIQVIDLDEYDSRGRLLTFFRSVAGRYSPELEVRLGILSEGKTKTMPLTDIETLLMPVFDR